MGTWGSGNFEDDTAADFLTIYTSDLIDEISKVIDDKNKIEPDEYEGVSLPCKIEILTMITEKKWVSCVCPSIEEVESWKQKYLKVYDEYNCSDVEYMDFILERRKIIEKTFENYKRVIEDYEE